MCFSCKWVVYLLLFLAISVVDMLGLQYDIYIEDHHNQYSSLVLHFKDFREQEGTASKPRYERKEPTLGFLGIEAFVSTALKDSQIGRKRLDV